MNGPHNINMQNSSSCAGARRLCRIALAILLITVASCTSTWSSSIRDYEPPSQSLLQTRAAEARDAISGVADLAHTAASQIDSNASMSTMDILADLDGQAWDASKAIASVRDVGDSIRADMPASLATQYDAVMNTLNASDQALQRMLSVLESPPVSAPALRREAAALSSQMPAIESVVADLLNAAE